MTIHNKQAFMDALWDWAVLDGCFGNTNISPSDVDGEVERNGHFLVLEAKGPRAFVTQGQQIKFNRHAQRGDTVMVIWGEPGKPERLQIWRPYEGVQKLIPCTLEMFRIAVSHWFEWADSNGR
jgi:hypothetical protein